MTIIVIIKKMKYHSRELIYKRRYKQVLTIHIYFILYHQTMEEGFGRKKCRRRDGGVKRIKLKESNTTVIALGCLFSSLTLFLTLYDHRIHYSRSHNRTQCRSFFKSTNNTTQEMKKREESLYAVCVCLALDDSVC